MNARLLAAFKSSSASCWGGKAHVKSLNRNEEVCKENGSWTRVRSRIKVLYVYTYFCVCKERDLSMSKDE